MFGFADACEVEIPLVQDRLDLAPRAAMSEDVTPEDVTVEPTVPSSRRARFHVAEAARPSLGSILARPQGRALAGYGRAAAHRHHVVDIAGDIVALDADIAEQPPIQALELADGQPSPPLPLDPAQGPGDRPISG